MVSSPCSRQALCWLPANSVTLSTDCLGTPENRKEASSTHVAPRVPGQACCTS